MLPLQIRKKWCAQEKITISAYFCNVTRPKLCEIGVFKNQPNNYIALSLRQLVYGFLDEDIEDNQVDEDTISYQ